MDIDSLSDRTVVLLVGMLVLFAPLTILALTLAFLSYTGDVILGRVTLVELLELYLIDLVVIAVFVYALYRLLKLLILHKLPASLDSIAERDLTETPGLDLDDVLDLEAEAEEEDDSVSSDREATADDRRDDTATDDDRQSLDSIVLAGDRS